MKRIFLLFFLLADFAAMAQQRSSYELRQAFVDLRFGMFIPIIMPTVNSSSMSLRIERERLPSAASSNIASLLSRQKRCALPLPGIKAR